MRIKIFTVGGTIDKVYFDKLSDYQVGDAGVRDILGDLPVHFEYDVESLMRKDSLEMTDEDRAIVKEKVEASDCENILITHGTDTMIQTAQNITPSDDKSVVLTGALEPANFKSSDAVFNVGMAIGVLAALRGGVHIVMNGRLFDPAKCRKNREAGRFEHV